MMIRQPYVWVLSFDALAAADWDRMMELPGFQRYFESAAYCRKVYSIYPTVTYPCHTTIVTGKYPVNHGITNNTLFQPKRLGSPDWNWKQRYIKGKTLYDLAYEMNMSTASFMWPVTGGARTINYNLPEVFPNRKWDNQVFTSLRNGSVILQAEAVMKFGKELKGTHQPEVDNFMHKTFMHTLKTRSPQVCFAHYVDLDSQRHKYGHDSKEADEALVRLSDRLMDLMDLAEAEGITEELTIVLLGDHSGIDEHTAVYLNTVFKNQGWITTDGKGRVKDWKVLMHTADGSAYIKVKDPQMEREVYETLARFSMKHDLCIEKIYSREEAKRFGASSEYSFMVEARRGYYFLDELEAEEIYTYEDADVGVRKHITRSTHGYSPYKKNYETLFAMRGPGIAQGAVIKKMHLIDEGPTIAHVLGGSLPEADGRLQIEFFR